MTRLLDPELWEIVGEGLVFVGVVLEVLCESKLIFKEDHDRRDRLETRGGWILIAGLAVSLAALIATNKRFDATIAGLQLQTSEANARAAKDESEAATLKQTNLQLAGELSKQEQRTADAEKGVASANSEAAKAAKDLADEKQRTLRLEQQFSWRTVTPEQKTKLRALLLSYNPHSPTLLGLPLWNLKISIAYVNQNPEAEEYADELKDALDGLGAEIGEPNGVDFIGPKALQGVELDANPQRNPMAMPLLTSLNSVGITVSGKNIPESDERTFSFIVGAKPRPKPSTAP